MIDAFILIGGKSTRLGRDKAFVEIAGQTMIQRAINTIAGALPDSRITVSAGSETQFSANILFGLGRPIMYDLHPGFGAWSALETALSYARTEWTFILACDLPNVSADFIAYLASKLGGASDAVVPRQDDGRLQPLCAFYRTRPCLAAVQSLFTAATMPPPVTTIFDRLGTTVTEAIPGDDHLLNVNTPTDLDLAKSRLR